MQHIDVKERFLVAMLLEMTKFRSQAVNTGERTEPMASKSEDTRQNQAVFWEGKLAERISLLTGEGVEAKTIDRDPAVKMIKARIKRAKARLRTIAAMARKIEDKARTKAEKLALPKEEKSRKKVAAEDVAEESKRQQKKKQKKEKKESDAVAQTQPQ